ncbi:unnamed protein product, partial [Polarella glacialis]
VWPAKGQKPSVKVTFALSRRPSSAAFIFSSVMRKEVGDTMNKFRDFLYSENLSWRHLSSPRAPLYDNVRRHLLQLAPPAGPSFSSIQIGLTFEKLSAHLPSDWADYNEPCDRCPRDYSDFRQYLPDDS